MPVITSPTNAPRAAPVLRPRMINAAASPVTAAAGDLLVIDASGGNVVVNPPASPAGGDAVELVRTDTSSNTVRWTGQVHTDTDGASLVGLFTGTRLTWTGSTWLISATNAGAPSPAGIGAMAVETNTAFEAFHSARQALANAGNGTLFMDTIARSTPLVTASGTSSTGSSFTLNRAGLWVGNFTCRSVAAPSSGEFYAAILNSSGPLQGAQGGAFGGSVATRSCPIAAWLPAGTVLNPYAYQSSGATINLESGSASCQFRIAWVHD